MSHIVSLQKGTVYPLIHIKHHERQTQYKEAAASSSYFLSISILRSPLLLFFQFFDCFFYVESCQDECDQQVEDHREPEVHYVKHIDA